MTVQPTEQCVQTFLRTATGIPGGGGGPASALRTAPSGKAPSAARPPAARPERRRKLRRSSPASAPAESAAASVPRRGSRWVRLISTENLLSLRRIAVDPVKVLDVGRVRLVSGSLPLVGIRIARCGDRNRHAAYSRRAGTGREDAEQIASA